MRSRLTHLGGLPSNTSGITEPTRNPEDGADMSLPEAPHPFGTPEYWTQTLGDLHKAANAAITITCGLIGYGLFGTKTLSDSDKCSGGNSLSEHVFLLNISAFMVLWLLKCFIVPVITSFVRGLIPEDFEEKDLRTKMKRTYILLLVLLMIGVLLMGLSLLFFVEVRFGLWTCLGIKERGLMLFLAFGLVVVEWIMLRHVIYICIGFEESKAWSRIKTN